MAKKKQKTASEILEVYIDHVLTEELKPSSVYKFCKAVKIPEQDFYKEFNSLEVLESSFWQELVKNSINLLEQDEAYKDYTFQHKLLSFYYTLFENMLLYRSYIMFNDSTEIGLEKLKACKPIRGAVLPVLKTFSHEFDSPIQAIPNGVGAKVIEEGLWLQFLSIYKFWIKDNSKGFESTDAFIEKSVTLAIDLSDSLPVDSVVDYGKFLYKEVKGML